MLLAFLLVDAYKINELHKIENIEIEGHEAIYNTIKGEVTSEKINYVVENYRTYSQIVSQGTYSTDGNQPGTYTGFIYGDFSEFKEFYNALEKIYNYPSDMSNICNIARQNISFFQKLNNAYEVRKNQKILTAYTNREISNYYNMDGTKKYIEYDFSSLLMFLMVLAGTAEILMLEKRNKMFFIVETSELGIAKNILAKLISMSIYILSVVVIFSAADLCFFGITYNIEGLWEPLYSIDAYKNTPLNVSVVQYIFLSGFLKYIALAFFGVVIFLFSFIFMDTVKTMAGGLLTFCLFVYLCINTKIYINPVALFVNYNLMKDFSVVNWFDIPVYYYQVILVTLLTITITISIGLCVASTYCNMSIKSQGNKNQKRSRTGGVK